MAWDATGRILLCALFPAVAACDGGGAPDVAWDAPSLALVAEIGCLACSGPESFGGVRSVTGRDGKVVVTTTDEPFVRIFDVERDDPPETFGREGQGPGELTRPMVSVPMTDGTIVVIEADGTLEYFDPTGVWRESTRIDGDLRSVVPSPSMGHVIALERAIDAPVGVEALVLDLEMGSVQARVPVPASLYEASRDRLSNHSVGHAITDEGEVVLGYGWDVYRIQYVFPDSIRSSAVTHDVPRFPMPDSVFAAATAPPPGGWPAGFTPADPDPFYSYFARDALRFDEEGNLWIRRHGVSNGSLFDIFDPALGFRGQVTLDRTVGDYFFFDGYLTAVMNDEVGVPYVGVWEVR